jgi:hypothetical protein
LLNKTNGLIDDISQSKELFDRIPKYTVISQSLMMSAKKSIFEMNRANNSGNTIYSKKNIKFSKDFQFFFNETFVDHSFSTHTR